MSNDIFNGLDFSGLDLTNSFNLASSLQRDFEEQQRESFQIMEKINKEACENRKRMQDALDKTAENTGETNYQLQKVIDNQNSYIDLLKKQLENSEKQLKILDDIFSNNENTLETEKELLECVLNQLDDKHPIRDLLIDKGGDVAVAGIAAGAPVIYSAIKAFLISKGIL